VIKLKVPSRKDYERRKKEMIEFMKTDRKNPANKNTVYIFNYFGKRELLR